jgi:hypothetical protein
VKSPPGCKNGQALYVVDPDGSILVLDPAENQPDSILFRPFALIECAGRCRVNNITLEMDGTLWVGHQGGTLCHTTLRSPKCDARNTVSGLLDDRVFGMTWLGDRLFASDYVSDGGTPGALWAFDRESALGTKKPKKVRIGNYTDGLLGQAADLAADDTGRLFGVFSGSSNLVFTEIDPSTGATPRAKQIAIGREFDRGNAHTWTLAFWDNMFWVFEGSRLWHVQKDELDRPEDGAAGRIPKELTVTPTGASRGPCVERSLLKPPFAPANE